MGNRIVNIKKFGAEGTFSYKFVNVSKSVTNFSRVDAKTTTIAGFDGGLDDYGRGSAPRAKGTVTVDMWLVASTEQEMTILRDEVAAITGWGVRELFMQPYDETEPERWCYARCVDIKMSEDAGAGTTYYQPVSLMFEVAHPFWYSQANLRWVGAPSLKIGSDWTIRGARSAVILEDGLTVSLENRGNAPAALRLELDTAHGTWNIGDPGVIIGDPLLYIGGYGPTNGGITVSALNAQNLELERWTWSGDLNQREKLVVDSNSLAVHHVTELATESGWDDFEIEKGSGFIRLAPGTTKIKFTGAFQGGTAKFYYLDAWTS